MSGTNIPDLIKDVNSILYLNRMVEEINRLFAFSGSVKVFFTSSINVGPNNNSYRDVTAATDGDAIYIVAGEDVNNNCLKMLIHEYVHVCVARTFVRQCPLWLNEGLAIILSGQEDVEPICPQRNSEIYKANQDSAYFYNHSLYLTREIAKDVGIELLIDKARNCSAFEEDNLFGIENVNGILQKKEGY